MGCQLGEFLEDLEAMAELLRQPQQPDGVHRVRLQERGAEDLHLCVCWGAWVELRRDAIGDSDSGLHLELLPRLSVFCQRRRRVDQCRRCEILSPVIFLLQFRVKSGDPFVLMTCPFRIAYWISAAIGS